MAQYVLQVNAWDVMDRVFVTAFLREYGDISTDRADVVLDRTTTVEGTGESDPEQWVRDALVALLEAI